MIVIGFLLFSMLVHDLKERLLVKYGSLRIVLIVFCKFTDLFEPIFEVPFHDLLFIVDFYFPKPDTQFRFLICILNIPTVQELIGNLGGWKAMFEGMLSIGLSEDGRQ